MHQPNEQKHNKRTAPEYDVTIDDQPVDTNKISKLSTSLLFITVSTLCNEETFVSIVDNRTTEIVFVFDEWAMTNYREAFSFEDV